MRYTEETNSFSINRKLLRITKLAISTLFYYSGLIIVFNKVKSSFGLCSVKILCYHNISRSFPNYLGLSHPPHLFEAHIKYLQDNYKIISLGNAIEIINADTPLKKDEFVITFDDNYKEYYTEVLPLKQKYDFEMTLFPAADPLQTEAPLFVDGLILAIDRSKKKMLDLTSYGQGKYLISTIEQKNRAIGEINEYSKNLSNDRRKDLLGEIFRQLDVDKQCLKPLLLTWNELIEMSHNGVKIGAHTVSHPLLANVTLQEAKYEILESKNILEQNLRTSIAFFAYPYGSVESYDDNIIALVREAGFSCACSLNKGDGRTTLYGLGRINMDECMSSSLNGEFSKSLFEMEMSGLADLVFLRWIKRSKSKSKNGRDR